MKVFTKLGLVLLAFFVSAGVLTAQSNTEYGPKSDKVQFNIPQTDDLFDLQFDWPVGVGGGEAGIETDGNYIYTSKWNGAGEFYRYEMDGTYLEVITVTGSTGCRDIAYNGTYFYGGAASTTIFEMDLANATMISTFTGPTACRAIAYNEDDDVFYCNNWSDDITAFDITGASQGSFPVGPVGVSYYGFAYQSASLCGDGPFLWGYAQTGNTLNELVQIELPSGTETGVYFDVGSVLLDNSGSAGGLCIHEGIVSGYHTIMGQSQNVAIWGLELCASGALPDDDLGVQSISAPNSGLNLTDAEPVSVLVKNYGNNTQTNFDVSFSLDGGSWVTETVSATINSGETYEHTFATTVDLSAYGTYDFEACVELTGDENPDNDCKDKTVENIEPFLCIDGLYTSGCGLGDGLVKWVMADVTVDPINCDGVPYEWYHDWTDMAHNVEAGMTYDLTVQAGYSSTYCDVWVDWDGDLYMDYDEHIVDDWELAATGVDYTTSITIPSDAEAGDYIIRFRTNWLGGIDESCETVSYGNMADFTLTVEGGSGGEFCLDGLYTSGCTFGDGLIYWDFAGVTIDPIDCDGVPYEWYHDFTDQIHYVEQGMTYTMTVEDGYGDQYLYVWVDWNNDFYMDTDEALVSDFYMENEATPYTIDISIPADAPLGEFAVRWRTSYFSTLTESCEIVSYGNMADLTLDISEGGGGPTDCYDFDDLTAGGYVAEQLGGMWTTWSNNPGSSEDALVTDAASNSAPNSFVVDPNVDLIFMFDDEAIGTGMAHYSHYMFVPSGSTGYFNVQSDPTPGVAWVIELYFNDAGAGQFIVDAVTTDFTYTQDTWFMVDIAINLDTGEGEVWFDGSVVHTFTTANTVGGIDYFGAAATDAGHYDDVCFEWEPGMALEPPTNLVGSVDLYDVHLEWDEPAGSGGDLIEIAYDDGTAEGNWWISAPSTADDYMAKRMTMPEDGSVQEIALFTYAPSGQDFNDVIVCADDGSGFPDLNNIYESFGVTDIPYTTADWLFMTLSTPLDFSAGDDFWILTNWPAGNDNGPFIGGDQTVPPTEDRNYWSNVPGTWNLWTGDRWMMRAYYSLPGESYDGSGIPTLVQRNDHNTVLPISTTTNPVAFDGTSSWKAPIIITGMEALTGYNVYRDGEVIDFTTFEFYDDPGLEPGTYDYYVTAVYDEGESEPSNTYTAVVEEIIQEDCYYFDDLTVGGFVAEQLGGLWTTWSGTPGGADDAIVTDEQSYSPDNSFRVDPDIDLVFQLGTEAYTTGSWIYSHYMYVGAGTTGYFNVQSDPTPGVAWVCELFFNGGGAGQIVVDAVTTDFTYAEDVWFKVETIFNLDADLGEIYFDGELIHSFTTANSIGGIDYFGGAATDAAYYDDVCFGEYEVQTCYDFDDLTVGGYVAEQLGGQWTTWSNNPGSSEDALVTDAASNSAPNSFIVDPNVDLIFQFGSAPFATGAWLYSHNMHVVSGTTGYFNVQSEPTPGVAWVVELYFNDGGAGQMIVDAVTTDFTYPQDEWFWVGVNIDVDNGLGDFWINDDIILSFETANTIGGIDYFGAAATDAAYYDDVCFDVGYEIMPPAPPTNLVATAVDGNMEVTWDAPSGDKSSIMTNAFTGMASGAPADKDPNAKNNAIPSDAQFDLLFDYGPAATAEAGIETDGMYIYTSIWSGTGQFEKYDAQGNFIEEFTIAAAAGCRDIAYNGTYFYGGAASTTIFEMDFDAQTMVSTFTGPAAARAIAYNDDDDTFYCNNWSDNITKFDMSGANLGSFPVGPIGASYYGFAYDNVSGGTYLWGYSQAGATQNELVQIELPSGTETGTYFDVGTVIDPAGSGIAGGLAIDGMLVPDVYTLVGNMQGISLFGLELMANTGLLGYNVYYSLDGGAFELLDFTTATSYTHEDPGYGEHCYYVTAVYDEGESDASNTDCDIIVGLEDNLAAQTQIFPNPATSVVNIKSDHVINNLMIYNFAGQLILNEQVSSSNHSVNVSQLNPGVYIFQIDTDEGRLTERIIVE